jgi:hypothetical protein
MNFFPPCFHSKAQFNEWMHLSRTAKERVDICDDCTPGYREELAKKDKCIKEWSRSRLKDSGMYVFIRKFKSET